MSRASRVLLGAAMLFHLLTLVSWRTGTLNPLFFDATVTHGVRGWDFYAMYQAGHNVLTGISAYESDPAKIEMIIPGGTYTPFRYLPLSAYTLGVALNLVPPRWAYRLWVAFIELVLLACAVLTWHLVDNRDRRARLTAMWLCYTPYYLEIYMGQFSFVQGTLIYVMLVLAARPRLGWGFDSAWVSSVLWKQNTALFLPLMVRLKRWRALLGLATLILLTSVPYFVLYRGSLDAFMRNLVSERPWFQLGNLGFRQFVFDVMWSLDDVLRLGLPESAYLAAQWAVVATLGTLALALVLLDRRPGIVQHLSLWVTAYFMVYHHVWEHHYVMLLPVLVALMMHHESPMLWILYVLLAHLRKLN